jgi:hypothetical protein
MAADAAEKKNLMIIHQMSGDVGSTLKKQKKKLRKTTVII